MNNTGKLLLLLVSFIEGGTLMAFEVLSAKIYTPFLGASIYVWTSILTVTLIGLAAGYWIGGKLSLKSPKKYLQLSLIIAGILIFLSTYIAEGTLPSLLGMNVKTAAIISGFLILFFPVMFMGTVSPLIISALNLMHDKLSSATGLIFGIGTIGGIAFLLFTIFQLIPAIGVQMTSFVLGGCLLVSAGLVSLLKISEDEKE